MSNTKRVAKRKARRPARRWHWRRVWAWKAYPKGIFLVILRSRFAPVLANAVAAGAVAFGALDDQLPLPIFIPGVLVLYGLGLWAQSVVQGNKLDAYAKTSLGLGQVVSALAGHRSGSAPKILKHPTKAVETLLQKARELAENSVQLPVGQTISANLIVPEHDVNGEVVGLIATEDDGYYPDRSHELIPLDAPGAPEAFLSGEPTAIPCVALEDHPRLQDTAYKSVGLFPIIVGEPASGGVVVAVLSLDSTKEYTFDDQVVKRLNPFVSPIAQLIGLALELRKEATREQKSWE